MHSHQPDNYICPFCDWLTGNETDYKQNSDIVYHDNDVTAFISPKWWVNNPGHVIVIPNEHHESLYDIPDDVMAKVQIVVKKIAIAVRESYIGCTGTSTRQHNEPDGNQDVWHYHTHVFPRYKNDQLYTNHENKEFVAPTNRLKYAKLINTYFSNTKTI